MADNNLPNFSENDPLDINELAALNNDISVDFIEQLQNKLSKEAGGFSDKKNGEETSDVEKKPKEDKPLNLRFDDSIDDNFIKKYKAKLNKQQQLAAEEKKSESKSEPQVEEQQVNFDDVPSRESVSIQQQEPIFQEPIPNDLVARESISEEPVSKEPQETVSMQQVAKIEQPVQSLEPTITVDKEIETLTSGNIVEKTVEQEQLDYNESLDFLDGNVKYSKYVIYIDPENTEFIDSLTVKERKNLINRILREQDDIAMTKRRLSLVQAIIKHSIIAIITVTISIPVIYYLINASLEASINNHRRAQGMFKTILNDQGKLKKTPSSHLK